MDRQLERSTVYNAQVLRRSWIEIDCAITQREAEKLDVALIMFTQHICG